MRAKFVNLSLIAAVLLLPASPHAGAVSLQKGQDSISGRLQIAVFDWFESGRSATEYWLTSSAEEQFTLRFRPEQQVPEVGSWITVRGRRDGREFHVDDVILVSVSTDGGNPTTGEQRVVVLLVNFQNNPIQNVTRDQVAQMFFASVTSADDWFREASYDKTWLVGDVFGWYTLPINEQCDPFQVRQRAIQAADPDVFFPFYNRLFILIPGAGGCGWGGLGTLGMETFTTNDGTFVASTSWCRSEYYNASNTAIAITAHEGGHNLGQHHARSIGFGGEALGAFDCGACGRTLREYGDELDALGLWNLGHYSTKHKINLGWFEPENVVTVTRGGIYALDVYSVASNEPKALKVFRGRGPTTGRDEWLFIEHRAAVGYDTDIGYHGGFNYGSALFHYDWGQGDTATYLLDMTPGDGDFLNPALRPGRTWTDNYTDLAVRALETDGDVLYVAVSYGGDLISMDLQPDSVVGSRPCTGTVSIGGSAPPGGITVSLTSSNPSVAQVPESVTIPEGQASADFPITTVQVSAPVTVEITADDGNGVPATEELEVVPFELTSFNLDPVQVTGGNATSATLRVNAPAPDGGLEIPLTNSDPAAATVPSSVTIPAGADLLVFPITTNPVRLPRTTTVTASYSGSFRFANLTVVEATLQEITVNPRRVQGGSVSTATATLTGPAPSGGLIVGLSSGNGSVVSVPTSVTVPSGAASVSFEVTTRPVGAEALVAIRGTRFYTRTAALTVLPPPLQSLSLNPASVRGGRASVGTVTIGGAAPVGGLVVSLSSSNSSLATVPSSVTIAAGATSATFVARTVRVSGDRIVTITASRGSDRRTASLTIRRR